MNFMSLMLLLIGISLINLSYLEGKWKMNSGLDLEEKALFLDYHNWNRARLSRGEIKSFPDASNMATVEWDDRLAEMAHKIAGECQIKAQDRYSEIRSFVGRHDTFGEAAINVYSSKDDKPDIQNVINNWFAASEDYSYTTNYCSRDPSDCQAFRNMIYHDMFVLGCSSVECKSGRTSVCVYANSEAKTNTGKLYKEGLSCTNCSQNYGMCMDGSMCATKSQCSGSRVSTTCVCLVNKEMCSKHGSVDEKNCHCRCQAGWTGVNCENECKDASSNCQQRKSACTNPDHQLEMREKCPETCGWCNRNPNMIPLFNEDGLKVNSIFDPALLPFDVKPQAEESCVEVQKKNCKAWAERNLCTHKSVQRECPISCGLCPKKNTNPTIPELEKRCRETSGMTKYCQAEMIRGKCNDYIMKKQCPITCQHPDCLSLIPKKSSTKAMADSEVCKFLNCYDNGVKKFCPIKCRRYPDPPTLSSNDPPFCAKYECSIPRVASQCSKCADPPLCISLDCKYNGVYKLCSKKCQKVVDEKKKVSTVPPKKKPETNPTSICVDQPDCEPRFINYCKIKNIKAKCPKMCGACPPKRCQRPCHSSATCVNGRCVCNAGFDGDGVNMCFSCRECHRYAKCDKARSRCVCRDGYKGDGKSCIASVKLEDPRCINANCNNKNWRSFCPIKCGGVTTKAPVKTDPSVCVSANCAIKSWKNYCPLKCGTTTTTVKPKTESPRCVYANCANPAWRSFCPIKCRTTSTTKPKKEHSACKRMNKDSCKDSNVVILCPVTCDGVITTTTKPIKKELPGCKAMSKSSCKDKNVKMLCPLTCGDVTTTTTKPTKKEHPACKGVTKKSCKDSNVVFLCPVSCEGFTTTTIATTTTKPTKEPKYCQLMEIANCLNPSLKKICSKRCTEPTVCAGIDSSKCRIKLWRDYCPIKCRVVSTTVAPTTISAICAKIKKANCINDFWKKYCPKLCTEPIYCESVQLKYCSDISIRKYCPIKCAFFSTTTAKPAEPKYCAVMKIESCKDKLLKDMCPKRCAGFTTTTKPAEPKYCATMKIESCKDKILKDMCPKRCAGFTTTVKSIDPPYCNRLKTEYCNIPKWKNYCPIKCGGVKTTVKPKTDMPGCTSQRVDCTKQIFKDLCPNKCSTKSKSQTTLKPDIKQCSLISMTSCSDPKVQKVCPNKCGKVTTAASKPSTPVPDYKKAICSQNLPCSNPGIRSLCKEKCVDKKICTMVTCNLPGANQMCPNKCAIGVVIVESKNIENYQ